MVAAPRNTWNEVPGGNYDMAVSGVLTLGGNDIYVVG
jgi:hypothetical protein